MAQQAHFLRSSVCMRRAFWEKMRCITTLYKDVPFYTCLSKAYNFVSMCQVLLYPTTKIRKLSSSPPLCLSAGRETLTTIFTYAMMTSVTDGLTCSYRNKYETSPPPFRLNGRLAVTAGLSGAGARSAAGAALSPTPRRAARDDPARP
ncbi:hypothetical protein EVAR_56810_1 [Eumeta japonica]|uniref:Uncharacterized protein n=1 Tax=Eumeta variegata TaxID=151549 RepID=A0A4C1Y049_EUMVA|nr:hypothetical protein EVAR_56810_1 [Eumeta japonica]